MLKRIGFLFAALGLAASLSANATPVTVQVNGTITSISDPNGLFPSAAIGETLSLTYVIDDVGIDIGSSPGLGRYASAYTMDFQVGDVSGTLGTGGGFNGMSILDNYLNQDGWFMNFNGPSTGLGLYNADIAFSGPESVWNSTSFLPYVDTALFNTGSNTGSMFLGNWYGNPNSFLITATITSMSPISPVPLPAAAWLLLSGLGGLGAVARCKRAAA